MDKRRRYVRALIAVFAGLAISGPAHLRAQTEDESRTKNACAPDRTSFRLSSNTPFMWKGIALAIADWRVKGSTKVRKSKETAPLIRAGLFPMQVKDGSVQLSSNVAGLKGKFAIYSGVIYPVDNRYCSGYTAGLLCNEITLYDTEQTLSMKCQLYIMAESDAFDP